MAQWIKKYRYQLAAFLLAFLPRVILNLTALPLRTLSDELATISAAAYFGGKDWSSVVGHASYYGFGFSVLFAPFFHFVHHPIVLYRTMLVAESLLQSLTALIAYQLMSRYYNLTDSLYVMLSAVACSYMVVTRAMIVYNEHALIFCSWLIAGLLLALQEAARTGDRKKRGICSLLLLLVLSYALLLHTRAVSYWIALAVIVVLYLAAERKLLLSWKILLLLSVPGYLGGRRIVRWVQKLIWAAGEGSTLKNAKIKIQLSFDFLNAQNRGPWSSIVLGQIHTAAVISGGILIFAMILGMVMLFRYFKCVFSEMIQGRQNWGEKEAGKNRKDKTRRKESGEGKAEIGTRAGKGTGTGTEKEVGTRGVREAQGIEWNYLLILVYFGLLVLGTIGAQSLMWLEQIREAMELGKGTWKYGMKAVTYVRYMGPYLGPVLMAFLAYAGQALEQKDGAGNNAVKKPQFRNNVSQRIFPWITGCGLAATWCLHLLWGRRIYPYVYQNTYALECYLPFAFQDIRNLQLDRSIYLPAAFISAALVFVFWLCYRRKQGRMVVFLLAAYLMYQYCYNAVAYDLTDQKANYGAVEQSYELVRKLEKQEFCPDVIYVVESRELKNHQNYYLYQFYMNRYKIIPEAPAETEEQVLLFTNGEACPVAEQNGYQSCRLDQNEYVWVKGERLQDMVRNCGVELHE